ncbi:hypothetical protein GCM10009837_62510 [Streptomyces durmitorensis]
MRALGDKGADGLAADAARAAHDRDAAAVEPEQIAVVHGGDASLAGPSVHRVGRVVVSLLKAAGCLLSLLKA